MQSTRFPLHLAPSGDHGVKPRLSPFYPESGDSPLYRRLIASVPEQSQHRRNSHCSRSAASVSACLLPRAVSSRMTRLYPCLARPSAFPFAQCTRCLLEISLRLRCQSSPPHQSSPSLHRKRFLSIHGVVQKLSRVGRHLVRSENHRLLSSRSLAVWRTVTAA